MKKYLIITGGAGFIGSNLIDYLLLKTNYQIISIDNYSSGKKNHINNSRVLYIRGDTRNISNILKNYSSKIVSLFHFGEFARFIKVLKTMISVWIQIFKDQTKFLNFA